MHRFTIKLVSGESVDNKELMPILNIIKLQLQDAKLNATRALKQIKNYEEDLSRRKDLTND